MAGSSWARTPELEEAAVRYPGARSGATAIAETALGKPGTRHPPTVAPVDSTGTTDHAVPGLEPPFTGGPGPLRN